MQHIPAPFFQNKPGIVDLNLELNGRLTDSEIDIIHQAFNSYYANIILDVHVVDSIPRTLSGKFRYLIQNLNQDL